MSSLLPDNAYLQFAPDLRICRLLNGLWQVSGGHGTISPTAALSAMRDYHEDGFTTWDLADHYGPAEDFIGAFHKQMQADYGETAPKQSQAFTKWVPRPGSMDKATVTQAVHISLNRMQTTMLDLLQFHWWDYSNPAYLDAMRHLADLRDTGLIRHLALTNFDTEHTAQIVNSGVQIVSNQVQFSLIDQRPAVRMVDYCRANNIWLLTYGTFCGGLLSDKYRNRPEPRSAALNTASLRKYKQMIDIWGGWGLFQELLNVLKQIADKHGVSLANVAVRAILDQPMVAGVIVGTRLGIAEHRAENARVFDLTLDDTDRAQIAGVTSRSRDLMNAIGDCGDEYR